MKGANFPHPVTLSYMKEKRIHITLLLTHAEKVEKYISSTHVLQTPSPFPPSLDIWKNWFIKLRVASFWFLEREKTHFILHVSSRPHYAQLKKLMETNLLSTLKGKGECTRRELLFEALIMWPLHYLVSQVLF